MRTELVVTSLALLLAVSAAAQPVSKPGRAAKSSKMTTHQADPAKIHNSAIVIDTHADTPDRFVDDSFDPATDSGNAHWDFAKARVGNLGAEFFSIWVDPTVYKDHYTRRALDMIDSVHQAAEKHPRDLVMANSVKDILEARSGPHKRIAALIGVEGGHAIEGGHPCSARLLPPWCPLHDAHMGQLQ